MATGTRSGGFSRKANPSARARISGKPKTQNIASFSRMNSFVRVDASSMIGGRMRVFSGIAKLPSGQRYEKILERRLVRRQRDQLRAFLLHRIDQLWHCLGQRMDAQQPAAFVRARSGA